LLTYRLFESIEETKNKRKSEILSLPGTDFEDESFVLYASYYILYIIGELARRKAIPISPDNFTEIWGLYPEAIQTVRKLIKFERENTRESYTHASFFVSTKPKKIFEDKF